MLERFKAFFRNRPLSGVVDFAAPTGLGDILLEFWLQLRSASVVTGTVPFF